MENAASGEYHARHWWKPALAAVIIIAALVWTAGKIKEYKFIGSNPNAQRVITVSGESKKFLKPDVASVRLTVSSESGQSDLSAVQAKNSERTNNVIGYLKSLGVKEEDIKTSNYSVYPRYNYSQTGQQFLGYTVRQDLEVKIRDLAKVGSILSGSVEKGANEVSGLQFTVDDPAKVREEMKSEAIKDAKEKAKKLSDELGVRLVRITNYSESGNPLPIYYESAGYGKGGGGAMSAPDVQPGQNELKVNIAITYEIE